LTRVWAERGSRPRAPRDQRYDWAYLFGAVCPTRDTGAALVLPVADGEAMNLHLAEISRNVMPGSHAVVLLDAAGWHQTEGKLNVPDNISLLKLPPYSPELNPVENIWQYLRQNKLSNRVFDSYEAIVDACCDAWNALTDEPGRIRAAHDIDLVEADLVFLADALEHAFRLRSLHTDLNSRIFYLKRIAQSFRNRNLHGRVERKCAFLAGGLDHSWAQWSRLRRGCAERLGIDSTGG
jgi:hypothetical protein